MWRPAPVSYTHLVEMNIDPKDPKKADRDRLVLSKGHAAPALYAALAERGYFPVEDLKTLRKIGSYLQDVYKRQVQDSVETALNSAGDVEFAATAEYHQWRKQGKPLPEFLSGKKN